MVVDDNTVFDHHDRHVGGNASDRERINSLSPPATHRPEAPSHSNALGSRTYQDKGRAATDSRSSTRKGPLQSNFKFGVSTYDSATDDLARLCEAKFGEPSYGWKTVSDANVLGLDAVVIAGTGEGKTIPFMMPFKLIPRNSCS